jgi:hypothetical protein
MKLDAGPALKFLTLTGDWPAADARAYHRAKASGIALESTLDRLLTRHAGLQVELVYPHLGSGCGTDS